MMIIEIPLLDLDENLHITEPQTRFIVAANRYAQLYWSQQHLYILFFALSIVETFISQPTPITLKQREQLFVLNQERRSYYQFDVFRVFFIILCPKVMQKIPVQINSPIRHKSKISYIPNYLTTCFFFVGENQQNKSQYSQLSFKIIIVIIMHILPKKRYESNRISYLNVPGKQKQSNKIKTQPVDSSKFVTRLGFKLDSNHHNKTSYADKNKSSPHIQNRKFNNKQRQTQYQSDLYCSSNNLTQRTQRQTQRQKFIKDLKTRVLRSENTSIVQGQMSPTQQKAKQPMARYHKDAEISKLVKQRVKSNGSLSEVTEQDFIKPRKESCQISVINIRSDNGDGKDELELRDRAKTFAKDFSKIVEENLNFKNKTCNEDRTKIIQANDIQKKINLSQSVTYLQNNPKNSAPQLRLPERQLMKSQILGRKNPNVSAQNSSIFQESINRNNTQKYEQEVQQITKEFLSDWEKMNSTKSQLYEKFRNKLVRQFPKMRKKYKESQLAPPETYQNSKRMSSSLVTPGLQSSIKISFHNQNLNSTQMNYLTVTQLKEQSQKVEKNYEQRWKQQQKRTLKQIFKQAHFYSKTKNKCFSVKYEISDEQLEQQRKIRHIQKNMTFMSYIHKRESKLNVQGSKSKHIRGENIIKNKDSILQLEKEGSPQQQFLLKCLDNAIEDCMKAE